jgi:hypothetical protein
MAALLREMGAKAGSGAAPSKVKALVTTSAPVEDRPVTFRDVLQGLQKGPRLYMELLQRQPDGLLDSKAWVELGLKKRGHISGVLTSLRNAFAKAGLTFEQVIERSRHSNGSGREHISAIRPEFIDEVRKGVPCVVN